MNAQSNVYLDSRLGFLMAENKRNYELYNYITNNRKAYHRRNYSTN